MSDFHTAALKELADQQVRYAPAARRQEQLARAEKLLGEVEPSRMYPYQFVCFRLTEFRPETHPDLLIQGSELKQDLALFIKRIEGSLPPLPLESAAEPMLSIEDVSRRFNVSAKTVSRWRMEGLFARHIMKDGRKQLGFPRSAVEAFAAAQQARVERGARFSRLSELEKDEIVARARRLADSGTNLTETSRLLADRLHRSAEAVRTVLRNHDRRNPDRAVFPDTSGPLDAASKERIYHAFQEGKPVKLIAERFGRTPSGMYRVINEVRAERLLREPVDYIHSPEFDDPTRVADIVAPMPRADEFFDKVRAMRPPKEVQSHMSHLYERPLLARDQEAHLFRKMNYLKHTLKRLQGEIDPALVRVQDLKKIDDLRNDIKETRDLLIECNQRLVHSLATKHLRVGQNLDELKSDANVSLMRAVEKFDYSRGFKFSTYATWAIMKNFARSIPDDTTRKSRYLTGTDEIFDHQADQRTDERELIAGSDAARTRVNRLLEYLDPRTREVIRMRSGLDGSRQMTLEQIGRHFGITKERVRQINVRGMRQLRERAAQEPAT